MTGDQVTGDQVTGDQVTGETPADGPRRGRPNPRRGHRSAPTPSGGSDRSAPTHGRPRSPRAHQAILAAAAELLLDRGLAAVSMDAIAERAGVSKATIYRWWPTKEALALDALHTEWSAVRPYPRDTGTLRGDLLSLMRPWARLVTSRPYARVLTALLTEAHTDPAFATEYRHRVLEPRRDQARGLFHRAVQRREIPADTNIELALDLLYGPLYHRLLHGHAPLDDQFLHDLVDMALGGIQPAPERPATPFDHPATP